MFGNKKTVIVEIGSTNAKVLALGGKEETRGKVVRLDYRMLDREPGQEAGKKELATVCDYLLSQYSRSRLRIELLLPFNQGYFHVFSLPWISGRDRRTAFEFLADEEIPLPAEDRSVDLHVIEECKTENVLKIAIGAVKKSWIDHYARSFEAAGLKVKGADFAASPFGYALQTAGLDNVLYLDNDGQNLNVMLYREGIPSLVRAFPLQQLREADLSGYWAGEIDKTLVRSGYGLGRLPLRILAGSDRLSADLTAALTAPGRMVPVEREAGAKLWFKLQCAERPLEELAVLSHAHWLKEKEIYFNFYGPEHKGRGEKGRKKARCGIAGGILLLLLLSVAGLGEQYFSHGEEENYQAGQVEESPTRLSQTGNPQAAQSQTAQNSPGQNRSNGDRGEKNSAGSAVFTGRDISQLITALSDQVKLTRIELSSGGLAVGGEAQGGSKVYQGMKKIAGLGWGAPQLSEYISDETGTVRFSCTALKQEESAAGANSAISQLPLLLDMCRQAFTDRGAGVTELSLDQEGRAGSYADEEGGYVLARISWQGPWQAIGAGLSYLEKEKGIAAREVELTEGGGQGILQIGGSL